MHTLNRSWAHQFNPPLWSIAFEVQLYVLFPVFLMLVARRVPVLLACAVLMSGVKLMDLLHLPLFGLAAWFFAGAASAHVARRRRVPHRVLLTVAVSCILLGLTRVPPFADGRLAQVLWMVGFTCLVTGLVRVSAGGWNIPTHALAVWLGHRSYSLYAIHFPVVLLVWAAVSRWDLSQGAAVVAMLAIGVPVSVFTANVLYVSVERPALARVRAVSPRLRAEVQP
jgi:peptidoglycan/LPS O-acetylase OafA/YrhL